MGLTRYTQDQKSKSNNSAAEMIQPHISEIHNDAKEEKLFYTVVKPPMPGRTTWSISK